jgi:accessory gene regulator protein AgrB
MLCLPGVLCWSLLLALFLVPRSMQQNFAFLRILSGPGIFLCWGVAILCALTSLAIYLFRSKPWYVWINLLVNVAGLLFSGLVLLLLLWGPGPD